MELREALTQITEIRLQMARTEVFRGYRALPAAFSGGVALAGRPGSDGHGSGPVAAVEPLPDIVDRGRGGERSVGGAGDVDPGSERDVAA